MSNTSIVIIGAGVAGIAAGAKLLENGFNNIILLEAENRIGGRVHTIPFGENNIDLGAQWCHGKEGNIVYEMVGSDELSETDAGFGKMSFIRSDGNSVDGRHCEHLLNLCNYIMEDCKEEIVSSQGSIGNFLVKKYQEAIQQPDFNGIDSELATQILEIFQKQQCAYYASDTMFDLSGYGYTRYKACRGPLLLNWKDKGFQTIIDYITKKRPMSKTHLNVEEKILRNKEVQNIDWSKSADECIRVKCSDGSEFPTNHVIVSVPLGVLKENHIKMFTPNLPKMKKNAIEGISFGTIGKIYLEFDKPWWPEHWVGLSLLWTKADIEEIKLTENYWLESVFGFYAVDYQPNILCGWIYGPKVYCMELLDDETIINGCMFIFKKFLSKLMEFTRPINVQTTHWATNKHFRGSYSFHSMTTDLLRTSSKDLAHPIFDPLGKPSILFAGEATHEDYFSTVHGAIESGYREARRILAYYGKY